MAVVKPGPLVQDIRGKLGDGVVFSNWKGKIVARRPATTIGNPMSDLQRPIREAITFLDHKYKNELSQAQKDGWDALAAELSSASAQYAAMESRPMNGFPKMGDDDASVLSGEDLFIATNMGRIQASNPSGVLTQDPAAQTPPIYRAIDDAPPASLMTSPEPPTIEAATAWNAATAELDLVYATAPPAFDPDLPPVEDLIESSIHVNEVYVRLGDPRVNRLRSFRAVPLDTSGNAVSIPSFWMPGGTTGTTTPWQIGGKYRIAMRTRTIYGRLSAWSNVFNWDATAP